MKGIENFTDIIGIAIGMIGALLKAIKKRMKLTSTILSMAVAGILCYSMIGLVEMLYGHVSSRVSILIAFIVGWTANEITEKMDMLIDDLYDYWLGFLKKNKNEKSEE
jgi:hypothetical protein